MLHLGCGLDSRYFRVDPGPDVEWYDVDYPDVARCARSFPGAASTTTSSPRRSPTRRYLAEIPADRPTLMIGEGLTMYLTREDGHRAAAPRRRPIPLRRTAVRRVQLARHQVAVEQSRWCARSGATLHWGDQRARRNPRGGARHRLLAWVPVFESESFRAIARRLPADGGGDGPDPRRADHGAVSPLRIRPAELTGSHPEHRLAPHPPVESPCRGATLSRRDGGCGGKLSTVASSSTGGRFGSGGGQWTA